MCYILHFETQLYCFYLKFGIYLGTMKHKHFQTEAHFMLKKEKSEGFESVRMKKDYMIL